MADVSAHTSFSNFWDFAPPFHVKVLVPELCPFMIRVSSTPLETLHSLRCWCAWLFTPAESIVHVLFDDALSVTAVILSEGLFAGASSCTSGQLTNSSKTSTVTSPENKLQQKWNCLTPKVYPHLPYGRNVELPLLLRMIRTFSYIPCYPPMLDLIFGTKFKVARKSFSLSIPPKFEHKLYIPINKDLEKLTPPLY